jgi:hypothetical protein
MLEDMRFISWQKQQNYFFFKTPRPAPKIMQPQLNKNHNIFSGIEVDKADIITTHVCPDLRLILNVAISPQYLSASMAHSRNTLLYRNLPPMYITLNRSHPFWSYTGTFSCNIKTQNKICLKKYRKLFPISHIIYLPHTKFESDNNF